MRRLALPLAAVLAFAACAEEPRLPPHLLPSGIHTLAVRTVVNKSQQFGLEDGLGVALRDEFLRDGRYPVVPENEADAVVCVTITRYTFAPTQYDVTLAPTSYKIRVLADVQLLDRRTNKPLGSEKDVEGSLTYPNEALAGGMTEAVARAQIWTVLAPTIVSRVIDGFGAALAAPAPSR